MKKELVSVHVPLKHKIMSTVIQMMTIWYEKLLHIAYFHPGQTYKNKITEGNTCLLNINIMV